MPPGLCVCCCVCGALPGFLFWAVSKNSIINMNKRIAKRTSQCYLIEDEKVSIVSKDTMKEVQYVSTDFRMISRNGTPSPHSICDDVKKPEEMDEDFINTAPRLLKETKLFKSFTQKSRDG